MNALSAKDTITVEGLDIECIIGIYEHERSNPQHVIVDAELTVDTEPAALSERIELTVDYEWVTHQIEFLLKLGKFQLLETAAHLICRTLLLPPVSGERRCAIEKVALRLRKPGALGGRGQPILYVTRLAAQADYTRESKCFGVVDIIGETQDVGFYRLCVAPRHGIALHMHRRMQEAEFVLSHGLTCQAEPARRSSVRVWPRGLAHRYDNLTDDMQSILCIDRPPFLEEDEIATDGTPGHISVFESREL